MAKAREWAITKATAGPEGLDALEYPEHKRACLVYSQWMSGYSEREIADFMAITVKDVKRDLQHMTTTLPPRTIIQHNNDRQRIILQRQEQENYNNLLDEGLKVSTSDYLTAGISPAGVLREYREAVGLTQKPEPLIQVNTQQNIFDQPKSSGSGIKSAEDAIRRVLAQMEQQEKEREVIEAEAEEQPEPEAQE